MKNAFLQPLIIDYRISRGIRIYLLLLHILAFLALWHCHLNPVFGIPPFLAVLGSLAWRFRQWRDAVELPPLYRVILDSENRWWLREKAADEKCIKLLPGTFVHPWLIILRFADEASGKYTLILCNDNLQADKLRRLRVRLRYPNGPVGTTD